MLTLDVAGIEMEIEEENNREVEDFSPSLAPQDEKKEKQRYDEMYSLISQVIESPLPIQNSNPPSTDKERLEIN